MDHNSTARRQAQRFLTDHVRNDWDWPSVPPVRPDQLHEVTEWRERSYAATSSEPDTDIEKLSRTNPYKFDTPDSIAATLENKKEERKRKRRRKEQEELAWNEGLQCFVQRRDVWTGVSKVVQLEPSPPSDNHPTIQDDAMDGDTGKSEEASDRAVSLTKHADAPSNAQLAVVPENPSERDEKILIPVAAPLLPDSNPLRASITPKSYTEIYNKVVLGSRTPSVPINLSDMTRALVQGWKDNGEWPPRQGPLDPLMGRRKVEIKAVKASGVATTDTSFLSHHPHVKKGVESMKKVFRLSGSHSGSHHNNVPSGEVG